MASAKIEDRQELSVESIVFRYDLIKFGARSLGQTWVYAGIIAKK